MGSLLRISHSVLVGTGVIKPRLRSLRETSSRLLLFCFGTGLLLYVLLWIFMPKETV